MGDLNPKNVTSDELGRLDSARAGERNGGRMLSIKDRLTLTAPFSAFGPASLVHVAPLPAGSILPALGALD
jgi:hypothetical protein